MLGILIDISIVLFFIISLLAGKYVTRKLIYRYYSQVELRINGTTIKKISQKEADRIIKEAENNPYFLKDQ